MIVSETMVSSGSPWAITRTDTDVGPDVVVGIAGGRTVTSITSRDPPNRVTFGRVTVVHAADRPAGMMVKLSVRSPTFSMTTDSDADEPGTTVMSS